MTAWAVKSGAGLVTNVDMTRAPFEIGSVMGKMQVKTPLFRISAGN